MSSHNKFIIIAVAAESSADFYKSFPYSVPSRPATASAEEHSISRSSSRRMVGDTNKTLFTQKHVNFIFQISMQKRSFVHTIMHIRFLMKANQFRKKYLFCNCLIFAMIWCTLLMKCWNIILRIYLIADIFKKFLNGIKAFF